MENNQFRNLLNRKLKITSIIKKKHYDNLFS